MSKLFSLFDDSIKRPGDVVTNSPQNLDSISSKAEDQELISKKIQQFELSVPKVDYSSFSNFVFFNSALDYFNITGEKILNDYPYDGTSDSVEQYVNDLDDYQKYVVTSAWPRSIGYLDFHPSVSSSHISINNAGMSSSIANGALLSPGTGSFSVEMWCVPPPALTSSSNVMVLFQKTAASPSGSMVGYTGYFSGSSFFFNVSNDTNVSETSAYIGVRLPTYFSCVINRDSLLISVLTGSSGSFPTIVSSSSLSVSSLVLGDTPFYVGSGSLSGAIGSLSGKSVAALTGSIDDVRVWGIARTEQDISSDFNSRTNAQSSLLGLWRLNESGSTSFAAENSSIIDASGHRLNGTIVNYFDSMRVSGTLLPYDSPDLILSLNSPEVVSYVAEQQTSASAYDRDSDNVITRLVPEQFFLLEQERGTEVLENFLYVLARQFDFLKIRIDQFVNVLRTNYSQYDQTPDALLEEVGKFFGWEFTGNFLNSSAFQYILGKNVLPSVQQNKEIEIKLFQIKNEFWKRVLINLMYLYKTKGTKESVESLLRIYGLNSKIVRLKEFGVEKNVGIKTNRISSEKSIPALAFGFSGSMNDGVQYSAGGPGIVTPARTIELRMRFPTIDSSGLPLTSQSGSIYQLSNNASSKFCDVTFVKNSLYSTTGSMFLSSSLEDIVFSGTDLPIFDDRWHNLAFVRDIENNRVGVEIRTLEDDGTVTSSSFYATGSSSLTDGYVLSLGYLASPPYAAQYWIQEVRMWDVVLSKTELNDHTLNFQSYGVDDKSRIDTLALHSRLDDNVNSVSGFFSIKELVKRATAANALDFQSNCVPFKKFLNEYNYIAPPEYGWSEDKIRIFDSSIVPIAHEMSDERTVSLEFNMIDALNEDISQIISNLESFNESIGDAANKYRDVYPDLETLRHEYFDRLRGRLNFRLFADMLEFFDRSFVTFVRRLLPARVLFIGDEFVVESHMLERPKMQWSYRRSDSTQSLMNSRIKVFIR